MVGEGWVGLVGEGWVGLDGRGTRRAWRERGAWSRGAEAQGSGGSGARGPQRTSACIASAGCGLVGHASDVPPATSRISSASDESRFCWSRPRIAW